MMESANILHKKNSPAQAALYTCTLCGKPGEIFFKNAFVCEDCINYIKSALAK